MVYAPISMNYNITEAHINIMIRNKRKLVAKGAKACPFIIPEGRITSAQEKLETKEKLIFGFEDTASDVRVTLAGLSTHKEGVNQVLVYKNTNTQGVLPLNHVPHKLAKKRGVGVTSYADT